MVIPGTSDHSGQRCRGFCVKEYIDILKWMYYHLIRHNPGITQAGVREQLKIDKGAAARRAASLEAKEAFCKTLDTLYWRSKRQSRAGFPDVSALIDKGGEGREE